MRRPSVATPGIEDVRELSVSASTAGQILRGVDEPKAYIHGSYDPHFE